MTQQLEVMKLALEALENAWLDASMGKGDVARHIEAITALRQTIEQAQKQEPHGYLYKTGKFYHEVEGCDPMTDKRYLPLYTSPPQRQWVGLTDEDYKVLREGVVKQGKPIGWMIENIEAKLKEKNT